jgi:hypothetical protein
MYSHMYQSRAKICAQSKTRNEESNGIGAKVCCDQACPGDGERDANRERYAAPRACGQTLRRRGRRDQ